MGREACLQLESSLTREWLLTNGAGGYAMGTVLACPTRRYHGLLCVTPPGLAQRHVLVGGFDESLHGRSRSFALSMLRYAGQWFPHGHQSIEAFELAPWPRFVYHIGQAVVTRELQMVRGRPITLVRYRIDGIQHSVELRLKPLLACREADRLTSANVDLNPRVERSSRGIACRPYGALPAVAISCEGAEPVFEADPVWYRGIEYQQDLARGYDGHEDQFSPGVLQLRLEPGRAVVVALSSGEAVEHPLALWDRESAHALEQERRRSPGMRGALERSAEDFLCTTPAPGGGERLGVIAGFPWFGEWGRDTCISLPGLLLARGRVEDCGDALEGLLAYLQDGLLPNIFGPTRASSAYNSVDAALWFVRAVRMYEQAGGRKERVLDVFWPALRQIGASYQRGGPLGIACDESGLIRAGGPGLNATWMDAVSSKGPVTPRDGCAVEINALWYFLLGYLEMLAHRAGDNAQARAWMELRRRALRSFLQRFWLEEERYLADTWKDGVQDRSVRPNMVLAAALEFSPLSRGKRTDIVRCAQAELLTPRGLRTLAPKNALYIGRYEGGPDARDRAYHQGTVWPWLIGAYVEASLRAYGPSPSRCAELRALLEGFAEPLHTQGLGHVSEVFDGDPPHRPGGCVAQAWSTAELLRAFDLLERAQT